MQMLLPAKYGPAVARASFLAVVALASFLLFSHFKLSTPVDHPAGAPAAIGRQAFALSFRAGEPVASSETSTTASDVQKSPSWTDFDDWFDQDEGSWAETGAAKVPERRAHWDPFNSDRTPITEIAIKSCMLSPGLYDMCSPSSSKKEDALRGVWQRVDRDLNKKIGLTYLYVYYRRLLPGSDAPVITNMTILNHAATSDDLQGGGTWVEVSESVRTGLWPRLPAAFLHYKLTSQSDIRAARLVSDDGNAGDMEPVTELDVIYGSEEVQPLPGYNKVGNMITGGPDDDKAYWKSSSKDARAGSSLAYRKALPNLPKSPTLRFDEKGNFTILQVADLHFSVGPGSCRDVDTTREEECRRKGADRYSLEWLESALDEVKPDLVVLTGDQINGQKTSWSSQSAIMKWAPILYSKGIPWTTIFGNHDEEETDLTSDGQIHLMQNLPYYIGETGPKTVDGHGNYVRSIRANDSDTTLTNLYFLDSHANAKSLNPFSKAGYDYIKANQINWFRGRSSQVKTYMRPYQPQHAVSSGSHRRPSRPGRPDRVRPEFDSLDDERSRTGRFARFRRQIGAGFDADDVTQDEDRFDTGGAQEGKGRQGELGALPEQDGIAGSDGRPKEDVGTGMMPSDGSQVKSQDDEEVTYETSNASESTPPNIQQAEEIEVNLNDLLAEDEYNLTPTRLAAGPTKQNPFEAKPNAIMFFHIPLQESYNAPIDVGADGKRLFVGERYESWGASKTNSGMFEAGIVEQKEQIDATGDGPVDAFWDGETSFPTRGRPEVKVVGNGHCHNSADCRRIKGVWLCFAGGSSFSGYGKRHFARRMRVYSLADYGETIESWHLLDTRERVDRVTLVGQGARGE